MTKWKWILQSIAWPLSLLLLVMLLREAGVLNLNFSNAVFQQESRRELQAGAGMPRLDQDGTPLQVAGLATLPAVTAASLKSVLENSVEVHFGNLSGRGFNLQLKEADFQGMLYTPFYKTGRLVTKWTLQYQAPNPGDPTKVNGEVQLIIDWTVSGAASARHVKSLLGDQLAQTMLAILSR